MSSAPALTFGAPVPILRMFDEAATRAFYLEFLGFTVEFEHRFEPDAPLYMGIVRDACTLHLSQHHGDATPGSGVRIRVSDLTAYNQHLLAQRYRHARPGILEQDWGTREMIIDDPSGNRLVFFEPRR